MRVGPYEVEGELGHGAYSTVYRARHPSGAMAALKVFRIGKLDARGRTRFEREVELLRRLEHPGIVRVLESGVADDVPWMALELVKGSTLGEVTLGVREYVAFLARIARAVGTAHRQGIVHRDLKPANVLVEAGSAEPRVVDFGLAFDACLTATRLTRSGEVQGTPAYMAPEVVRGEASPGDPRRDVFSLGVMLHERLAGAHPFAHSGDNVYEAMQRILRGVPSLAVTPLVDEELARICDRACALDAAKRPPDADAMASELEAWLARAPKPGPRRRGPLLVALGAITALLLTSTAIFAARGRSVPVPAPPPPAPPIPAPAPLSRPAPARASDEEVASIEGQLRATPIGPQALDPEIGERCRALAARFPGDPRARFLGLLASAFEKGRELEARRDMVKLLREGTLGPEELAWMSIYFRTLGFDRAACCVGEETFPADASRPAVLSFYEVHFHLLCEPPVNDADRAEALATRLLAAKTDANAMGMPPRWLLRVALSSARVSRGQFAEAEKALDLALLEAPPEHARHLSDERNAIRLRLVRPMASARHFGVSLVTTPFLHDACYQEDRAIETEPRLHVESLVALGDRAEQEGMPEHAALARLKAARFFRETQRFPFAREALEKSVAARLPGDTGALVRRALARSLILDEPIDPARAEALALEAAAEVEGFDPRTRCERADAWALVARARLARRDEAGARAALASGRALAPRDARELDEVEALLGK
jgi:hypothetical protein